MGNGSVDVSIGGLSTGNLYGYTSGTITCCYEDTNGTEYTYEMEFETNIMSPFTQTTTTAEKPADTSQWWIIMVIIIGIFLVLGGIIIGKCVINKKVAEIENREDSYEKISEENKTE